MVRSRSGSSLVEGASASSVTVEPEPALEMGVFSYRCHGEEQQEEECVICLSEYQEGVSLVALQRCQHNFHVECIRRWLNCMPRCPICNASTIQGLGSHVVLAGSMREGTIGREDNV
ncbi:hypothetical protein SUGI_1178520 [Cryptomeria japonica]|uniref:RING-H2 finger protein ATL66-like n=1 Tax=Cryptomeria japonica TaxID=3369 RepID=UPI0024148390|nr:RING-H2 finger protein ATL66-like [Cryptomeria japonica]GLJ54882.1 hypothetical protein SUGI_1178520 [Cryptomeria japonica]